MAVIAVIVMVLLVILSGWRRGLLAASRRPTLGSSSWGRSALGVVRVVAVVGVVVVRVVLALVVLAFVALGLVLGVGLVELVEHLLGLLHNLDQEELGGHLGVGRASAVEDLVSSLDAHGAQLDLRVDHIVLVLRGGRRARLLTLCVGRVSSMVVGVVAGVVMVVGVVGVPGSGCSV